MEQKNDKLIIKESYNYLKNICKFLSDYYEYRFDSPATEEEITEWENKNKVKIPSMLKEWLLLTKECDMTDRCWCLYWPEIDESDKVLIGSFGGDGEYLYFSKTTGEFFAIFEGEIESYESFDSVLVYISLDLEEKAEEIYGEDWLEVFEEQYE